jgi:hypothetical protein
LGHEVVWIDSHVLFQALAALGGAPRKIALTCNPRGRGA